MLIASPGLVGAGRLTGAWRSLAGDVLAVASAFPLLTAPPARASYAGQRLRYRLALHRPGERRPFASFDDLPHPVTAVAFHPVEPVVWIGAGEYDGGWMFEGDLVLWNWRDGSVRRPFSPLPEVAALAFEENGEALTVLVRPWDETTDELDDGDDPFRIAYRLTIRPADVGSPIRPDLTPDRRVPHGVAPGTLTREAADAAARDVRREVAAWLGGTAPDVPGAVWDLAWLADGRVAAAMADGSLRLLDPAMGAAVVLSGDPDCPPVAILPTAPPTVHLASRPGPMGRALTSLAILEGDRLTMRGEFAGSFLFSASRDGRLLGRLDRSFGADAARDMVLEPRSTAPRRLDLGHYDVFNHHLRVDGAPDLYFLQATPPGGHRAKWLCRLGQDTVVQRLWPVLPDDGSDAAHAMDCCGGWVEDDLGPGIVIAGIHYAPDPRAPRRGFLYRRAADGDAEVWRQATAAGCTAIVHMPEAGLVAAAFLDGTLRLIDAQSGATRLDASLTVAGLPTVVFALASVGCALALGTFDGAVAILQADDLLSRDHDGVALDGLCDWSAEPHPKDLGIKEHRKWNPPPLN